MYGKGGRVDVEKRRVVRNRRLCWNCKWWEHGWCGCLFGQHDKEMREHYEPGCGDWASLDATEGFFANGSWWGVVGR